MIRRLRKKFVLLCMGVVVAVIRTGHDQQRKGKHNPVLAVLNLICKIYVTVIRAPPCWCS